MSPPSRRRSARRAFSLVEVTLALGLVTFVLVAVIGTVPIAMSNGRQSFDQNRAAAVADSLFASFRSQPFSNVCYLDNQFDSQDGVTPLSTSGNLNLNTKTNAATDSVQLYASFLEASASAASSGDDTFGFQRKLAFTPAGGKVPGGTSYLVTLYFNNKPDGMTIPAVGNVASDPASSPAPLAEANQIEMVISPVAQPANQYHFVSTIANRL